MLTIFQWFLKPTKLDFRHIQFLIQFPIKLSFKAKKNSIDLSGILPYIGIPLNLSTKNENKKY